MSLKVYKHEELHGLLWKNVNCFSRQNLLTILYLVKFLFKKNQARVVAVEVLEELVAVAGVAWEGLEDFLQEECQN